MLFGTLLLAAAAVAAPTSPLVVHEKRDSLPYGHVRTKRVDPMAVLPIHIALTQSNLEQGYDHLMSVSHPHSPDYGKHWTIEEIHAKFAPSEESIELVKTWLEDVGLQRDDIALTTSNGWMRIEMLAKDAERIFQTEYHEHEDAKGRISIGCDEYHLPTHLTTHVDHIKPGVALSTLEKKVMKRGELTKPRAANTIRQEPVPIVTSLADCGAAITPTCIKALYDIPNAQTTHPENFLGVYESGSIYDQLDLDLFFSHFAPWVPNGTHPVLVSIDGATNTGPIKEITGESVIDFDLAFSLLYPQTIILYQVPDEGTVGLSLLEAVDGTFCTEKERQGGSDCGTAELTRVLSASYSSIEIQTPPAQAKRICLEFMKLGLKGHSFFFASGDYGVASPFNPNDITSNGCINPEHLGELSLNGTVFNPNFPASCPYVTTVGATKLNPGETVDDPEHALHLNAVRNGYPSFISEASAGGFSNYFPRASYQETAVQEYFATNDPTYPYYQYSGINSIGANGGLYNRAGRAFPDVSANGARLLYYARGEFEGATGAGTSLATPIWASIINLINEARTEAGKGPVGFINPVLYEHPEVFNDITIGYNPGCGTEGFKAVKGWDPVTGLGTPNYPKLLDLFMSLP